MGLAVGLGGGDTTVKPVEVVVHRRWRPARGKLTGFSEDGQHPGASDVREALTVNGFDVRRPAVVAAESSGNRGNIVVRRFAELLVECGEWQVERASRRTGRSGRAVRHD